MYECSKKCISRYENTSVILIPKLGDPNDPKTCNKGARSLAVYARPDPNPTDSTDPKTTGLQL